MISTTRWIALHCCTLTTHKNRLVGLEAQGVELDLLLHVELLAVVEGVGGPSLPAQPTRSLDDRVVTAP